MLIKADMPLYATAAERRLGELTGDEQRVAQAEAAMSERGVSNPPRMARLLIG